MCLVGGFKTISTYVVEEGTVTSTPAAAVAIEAPPPRILTVAANAKAPPAEKNATLSPCCSLPRTLFPLRSLALKLDFVRKNPPKNPYFDGFLREK